MKNIKVIDSKGVFVDIISFNTKEDVGSAPRLLVGKKAISISIDGNPTHNVKSGKEVLEYVLAYAYSLNKTKFSTCAVPTGDYYVFHVRPSRDEVELNDLSNCGTGITFDKKIGNTQVISDVAQAMLDFGISSIVITVEPSMPKTHPLSSISSSMPKGFNMSNPNIDIKSTSNDGNDESCSNYPNKVFVDYKDPYESFGWRGRIHLEIDLNTQAVASDGWHSIGGIKPLSKYEEQKYIEFFCNVRNLLDFFNNRLAHNTPAILMGAHYKSYECRIQWGEKDKTICVGEPIPYKLPF